jgi:hypothetical protein
MWNDPHSVSLSNRDSNILLICFVKYFIMCFACILSSRFHFLFLITVDTFKFEATYFAIGLIQYSILFTVDTVIVNSWLSGLMKWRRHTNNWKTRIIQNILFGAFTKHNKLLYSFFLHNWCLFWEIVCNVCLFLWTVWTPPHCSTNFPGGCNVTAIPLWLM